MREETERDRDKMEERRKREMGPHHFFYNESTLTIRVLIYLNLFMRGNFSGPNHFSNVLHLNIVAMGLNFTMTMGWDM
jgi:hypothetical protein